MTAESASWQKEHFSLAYVAALATLGGCTRSNWTHDKDGVDVTLRRGAWMVDLQMKCSSVARIVDEDFVYDLDVKTYDKLRSPERSAASFLGLVVVPEDINDWIHHTEQQLLMSCAGYYAKILNLPPAKGVETIAIHLPRRHLFGSEALRYMFDVSRAHILGSDNGAVA
jgi:Domain of unknown function (DUF4365)